MAVDVPTIGLAHRIRPAAGEPRGAIVLLHGRGADEHDLFGLLDLLDPQRRLVGVTFGGPLSLPPGGKHWYVVPRVGFPDPDTFRASFALLQASLDGLGIRAQDTILGGFSQGTVMSWALALGPDRPAPRGVIALSGFIPTVEGFTVTARPVPAFIAHGTQDPVISVDFARDAKARLEAAGAPVEYHEFAGAHRVDPRTAALLAGWVSATV